MELTTVLSSRRSIRAFRIDALPQAALDTLARALQLAPTANNHQPFRFIFVQDPDLRETIAERACHQEHLHEAPLLVVATCEAGRSFDVAIAVDHMILAATDIGLGTCWVGWFEKEPVREILGIPSQIDVPIIVPVGYAAESPEPRERKPVSEIIGYERY